MKFVPLHIYSGYSFLRSGLSVDKIVRFAKSGGYDAIGLSDYCSLTGFGEFYHALKGVGVAPVFGLDLEIEGSLFSCFAKNEDGYHSLIKLNLLASEDKLTLAELQSHSASLAIVLDASKGPVYENISSDIDAVRDYLLKVSKGMPDFRIGVPYLPDDKESVIALREFVERYPYTLIAYPHYLYEKKGDAIVIDIVSAIANDVTLENKKAEGNNYFLDDEDISSFYTEQEIKETLSLKDSTTSFEFIAKRGSLLHYPNELGLSSAEYLRKKAYEGLSRLVPNFDSSYQTRLDYELGVIDKMGYSDYFLVVADYVNWSLANGISVGPGRGSGAGSLVSYCLGIVTPDPLKYDLLFERFLNPERKTMPDIDVDFADIRREEVVSYLANKWGHNKVAHIVTMQTIGAKQSLRDIGRVYGYETRVIDLIAKTITDSSLSLRQDYKTNKQFRDLVDSDPFYLEIVSLASKIEGLPRQSGLHAAGVVLNNQALEEAIPVFESPNIGYVVGYEMNYLEEQGFLKMDVLGLRNLSTVDECLRLVKLNTGKTIIPREIPWEDPKAISLIASGKTMGLFQLESEGIRRAVAEIKPTCFEDVVAILALYRPGPMDNIPSFARRKHGQERITYIVPELEPILRSTYGVIVYQEQIMQIVQVMAGFSLGEADLFRRAISKKDAAKLEALKGSFIKGCLAKGHNLKVANETYDLIYKFADYGFNKAHALAYAILTCQMAWLKAYYPNEFYAAILDFCGGAGDSKHSAYISEIKKAGLSLALPDVNLAERVYVVKGNKIIFPLSGIKGIGGSTASDIIEERAFHGPYLDIFDFAARTKKYGINLATLVRLVDAGALDSLHPNRNSLRASASSAMSYAEMMFGEGGTQVLLDLGLPKPQMAKVDEDKRENLTAEYEALGMMISGSPLSLHQEAIKGMKLLRLGELESSRGYADTVGVIKSIRVISTKRGGRMCFMALYDDTAEAEFILFDEAYNKSFKSLQKDAVVKVRCRKDNRREGVYLAEEVSIIE